MSSNAPAVNLAAATRLRGIRKAVQSFVLPEVQSAAYDIAVYAEDVGDLIGFGERRNELHFNILPEGKIPDYLCTIT